MTTCPRCDDCGWICEVHQSQPWIGSQACPCDAPAMPCPECNPGNELTLPRLSAGVVADD
jgi:hypothetical protein